MTIPSCMCMSAATYWSTGRPAICQSRIVTGLPRVSESENLAETGTSFSWHMRCHSVRHSWHRRNSLLGTYTKLTRHYITLEQTLSKTC